MDSIVNSESVVQHLSPVWRTKSDYILQARLPEDSHKKWEQLWTHKHDDGSYEICCIPFAVYDLALGDRVKADDANILTEVVQRSGNWTVGVWFGEVDLARRKELELSMIYKIIKEMGCLMEWYSEYLLAINADTDQATNDIVEFLKEKEIPDSLVYETGWP